MINAKIPMSESAPFTDTSIDTLNKVDSAVSKVLDSEGLTKKTN